MVSERCEVRRAAFLPRGVELCLYRIESRKAMPFHFKTQDKRPKGIRMPCVTHTALGDRFVLCLLVMAWFHASWYGVTTVCLRLLSDPEQMDHTDTTLLSRSRPLPCFLVLKYHNTIQYNTIQYNTLFPLRYKYSMLLGKKEKLHLKKKPSHLALYYLK